MYLLMQASDSGAFCRLLDEKELRELLAEPELDIEFLAEVEDLDTNYWNEHAAALFEVKLLVPERRVSWVLT